MEQFVTKDSGKKAEYASGMQRDTQEGKPAFHLMLAEGIPFEDQFLTRLAGLYARGAEKYGARNFEKACTKEDEEHIKGSYLRHVIKHIAGVQDGEDHGAAAAWNAKALEDCRWRMRIRAAFVSQGASVPLHSSYT